MNVIYDSLVKTAVSRATRLGMQHDAEQRLPSEDTAIFANNKKLTKDLGKAMMYNVEKEQAQNHLAFNANWENGQFNKVD